LGPVVPLSLRKVVSQPHLKALAYSFRGGMEKIKIVEEKILEVERTIMYAKNPSQEEIDAQILTGTREHIINQVARQTQVIAVFNGILNDLRNGIDQIG
jgi:hypothetical protein